MQISPMIPMWFVENKFAIFDEQKKYTSFIKLFDYSFPFLSIYKINLVL